MTQNQISFLNYEETKRSNLANEGIKRESNEITRSHYIADEAIQSRKNDISEQANLITRGHYQAMDTETARSNRAREKIQHGELKIAQQNADTNRMNAITNQGNLQVNWYNADTNRMNAGTNYANYVEQSRHNRAQEAENKRTNIANEQIKSYSAGKQAQYWDAQVQNQKFINEANAAHLKLQDKFIPVEQERKNYETSAKIKQTEADTVLKKQQTEESKAKSTEKKTKSVKNIVDAAATVTDQFFKRKKNRRK